MERVPGGPTAAGQRQEAPEEDGGLQSALLETQEGATFPAQRCGRLTKPGHLALWKDPLKLQSMKVTFNKRSRHVFEGLVFVTSEGHSTFCLTHPWDCKRRGGGPLESAPALPMGGGIQAGWKERTQSHTANHRLYFRSPVICNESPESGSQNSC
ncbi:uncharacterized protein LOC143827351 [Paroedura picta]|uniref:uncharacterized protein LOC143827351 n=1 Tax=Paroedura picta TaxID=143630 RepID=UPI004055B3E6